MINPGIQQNLIEQNRVKVKVEFPNLVPADYYLYILKVTPVISTSCAVGDIVINIVSNAGIAVGDVVTFYEDTFMFQSLVTATATTTITVASPIDNIFTSSAIVEVGTWNLKVNGSITSQTAYIKSPPSYNMHIHTLRVAMLDTTDMDDGKFGGITALAKGIYFRLQDGFIKNLALIVNNLGFWEIGFVTSYSDKAPSGQYGFRASRDMYNINGTTALLDCTSNSEFQLWIQDDLTDLEQFTCTVSGHIEPCE